MTCPHLAGLRPGPPRTPDGCEECLKAGTPPVALGFLRR
jgi:hypothetical protein